MTWSKASNYDVAINKMTCSKALARLKSKHGIEYHECLPSTISSIQSDLLKWYHVNGRSLPWRVAYSETSSQELAIRSYRVWVSEIMLQQTQVETVKDYFTRWMEKWPNMESLSQASEEEVHQVWAGLGYYSRASRMHKAALLIVKDYNGQLPASAQELQDIVPGVGPYTAGAISSIAFNVRSPLVDGNVVRVFSRLFGIASNAKSKTAMDWFWKRAGLLVDDTRPGDFNQALMDLGATVCTPQNPTCGSCPLSEHCTALAEFHAKDALLLNNKSLVKESPPETPCNICEVEIEDLAAFSVGFYPPKADKKASRQQFCHVAMIHFPETDEFLLVKGPPKGLLANLYDFPNVIMYDNVEPWTQEPSYADCKLEMSKHLQSLFHVEFPEPSHLGQTVHVFSHIKRTMNVDIYVVGSKMILDSSEMKWVSRSDITDKKLGIPKTCLKALALTESKHKSKSIKRVAVSSSSDKPNKKQTTLGSFFKPVA